MWFLQGLEFHACALEMALALVTSQNFGQCVSCLVFSVDLSELHLALQNMSSNPEITYVQGLGPRRRPAVAHDAHDRLVVFRDFHLVDS